MNATRERKAAILTTAVIAALVTSGVAAERWRLAWDPNPEAPGPSNGPAAGYVVRWSGESRTSATYRGRTGIFRIEGRLATNGPVFSNLAAPLFADVTAFGPSGIEGDASE